MFGPIPAGRAAGRLSHEESPVSRVLHSPTTEFDAPPPGFGGRLRDMSAWGLSLAAHGLVLVLMSLVYFDIDQRVTTLIDSAFEDVDPAQYKFDTTVTDQVGSDSNINTLTASQEAANAVGQTPQQDLESRIDETLKIEVPSTDRLIEPARAEMLAAVQTTGSSEHAGGVEGAMDRMAFEIANSLREQKTLVVWMFDVSPSLHVRREKIAERVENIYNQLNAMNVGADKALVSAVATFGERSAILTKDPLDNTAEVIKAVRGIKSEESGLENTFSAVIAATKAFQSFRTRQPKSLQRAMMLVIVTDEAGSDVEKLEDAILLTKRYGIKTYVIGDGAPLGRKQVETEFTLENGETIIGVMDRGPEGYFQDRLRMAYWGTNGRDLDFIPSGFGPYGLTRLCAETNGLFLIADNSLRAGIDSIVMRSYAPDYRPIPQLEADIRSNRAKLALVEVCNQYQVDNIPIPSTFFPAENDNVLRTAITEAQRPLAELDYRLDGILQKLQAGEKDRAKVTEPRWRATYDLALGRVLAMRVRSYGYNMMLAEMKSAPRKFEKSGSNQWRLVPSRDITSGASTKKMANQASELLKRVIDEHAGTPWAILAEREYSTPMGWEWREGTYNPAPPGKGGNNKPAPRFIEEVDPKTGKTVKRQLPSQPVRREI
jgi:hypothetical protein